MQGVDETAARETWSMINAMGAWQMNKSHTRSYAVISYWTAYLKAHFPLEFAAANLRNAKDEESAIWLLREMVNEGITYEPFNLGLSEANWCVKGGKLLGGFMALKGFGEVLAAKFIALRDAGELTPEQLEKIRNAENVFTDIFQMRTRYGAMYENPQAHKIIGPIMKISELNGTQIGSHVFLGEVVYKNQRDINEEINVKKRNGKRETGPKEFVDVRLRDDTGVISARVGRWDFERMGRSLLESVPLGAHLLIRARFVKDIRFGFIERWKRLDITPSEEQP